MHLSNSLNFLKYHFSFPQIQIIRRKQNQYGYQKYELSETIHILLKDIFKHFCTFLGYSIQCIQCGNQENSYQCTGSDSGRSTECPSNIAYCQKISALAHGLTFKQCGMISLPGIDQNEIFAKADLCVPNIVSFLIDI